MLVGRLQLHTLTHTQTHWHGEVEVWLWYPRVIDAQVIQLKALAETK